jgi:hypothetical protein
MREAGGIAAKVLALAAVVGISSVAAAAPLVNIRVVLNGNQAGGSDGASSS